MGSSFCLQDELGRQEINILLSCHHMPGTALGTNFNSVWFSPALILHRENSRAQGGGTNVLRVILISDQDLDPNLSNSRVLLLIPHPENTRYQERKTAVSVEKEKSHQRQMPASLYGWWRGEGVTLPRGTKGCHCQSLSPKAVPRSPRGFQQSPFSPAQ